MRSFLVESALLSHGLASISNEELLGSWPFPQKNIVWLDHGEIVIGHMVDFLKFRLRKDNIYRIDYQFLPRAIKEHISGALTASGTMAVCEKLGFDLAVTCGMGGIGDIKAEKLCPDLPALLELPVALLTCGPKDVVDIAASFDWLSKRGVTVYLIGQDCYSGYIFNSVNLPLVTIRTEQVSLDQKGGLLLINQIPGEKKLDDLSLLKTAMAVAKKAEAEGQHYHPAANAEFDRLTGGYSSYLQFEALKNNVRLAAEICNL
ncbi:MAG: hypothetical protein GX681_02280 [Clostridiaceae bacterium]|nr:hypothetical protein [Clostridiaceae bacterium]